MSWGAIVVGAAGMIYGAVEGKKNRETAEGVAEDALFEQKRQQAILEKEK